MEPEMAWGLHIWEQPLDQERVQDSLQEYEAFYKELHRILSLITKNHKHFIVLDMHSYNYRRAGPYEPPDDPHRRCLAT